MIRQSVTEHIEAREIDHDPQFTWRGRNVTRIENLSDIVFALALGMLVSASSPPVSYPDLKAHMLNIVPVTAAFAILLLFWNMHFLFFRRYALGDGYTIFLNAILLLLILFIAYPLRFIFDSLFAWLLLLAGYEERIRAIEVFSFQTAGELMSIYAIGYALIFTIYMLMYRHALKMADEIGLSDKERAYTKLSVALAVMQIMLSIIVAISASFTPLYVAASAFFFLNWPIGLILRWHSLRKLAKPETA